MIVSPLYIPADGPKVEESAIQHFHDKLVLIRDRLKTSPGKALGEKRHSVVSLNFHFPFVYYLDW